MSISIRHMMSERRYFADICQWTIIGNLNGLSVVDFLKEGLELPEALLAAVHKRQMEFLCGRLCAKRCLESLGLLNVIHPLPIGKHREAIWPPGMIGSISHTDQAATAIVARQSSVESIGIDIEQRMPEATPQLINHVCVSPLELDELLKSQQLSREDALTVIFSAKESLYKALELDLQQLLEFQLVWIESNGPQSLRAVLLADLHEKLKKGMSWSLRWNRLDRHLIETVIIKNKLF